MKMVLLVIPLTTFLLLIGNSMVLGADRGPVGWSIYRDLNLLTRMRSGVRTRQLSSFDRTGGNHDGGLFSCLRNTTVDNRCVIAEWSGPGEITKIAFTQDYGLYNKSGRLYVELDNQEIINHDLQAVIDGKLGAPFVWPLVAGFQDTQGTSEIQVPMTFKRSMRVMVDRDARYDMVTFRTFASDEGIETFDPVAAGRQVDVLNGLKTFGLRDSKPETRSGHKEVSSQLSIAPNSKAQIFKRTGSGQISEIKLQLPQLVRGAQVIDDGRAFGPNGYSTFFVRIEPNNLGVQLTRRLNSTVSNQIADVVIDGVVVGQWNNGPASGAPGLWGEETFLIPANLTAGKRHLNVRNVFVSSDRDFTEFRYDVDCLLHGNFWIRTDVVDVGTGRPSMELTHDYEIYHQTWADFLTLRYPVDAKILQASNEILQKTKLRMTFDGRPTVDAPLGLFFGSGLGMYDHRSIFLSIDATTGWFSSWWPMPFGKEVVAELVNLSNQTINNVTVVVKIEESQRFKSELAAEKIGYFHATQNQKVNVDGEDYIFLNVTGHGVFCAVSETMRGLIPPTVKNMREYLEGDERVYVDGALTPTVYGTGTEDFFGSGWYFNSGKTVHNPLLGCSAHELMADGCQYDCTGASKIYVQDAIHFQSSIVFGIEHGGVNTAPSEYESVAYWYGHESVKQTVTDVLNVTCPSSRAEHKYNAQGESKPYLLTSSFEGNFDKVNLTWPTVTTTGSISFELKIDADNDGVRIYRINDHETGYQTAKVLIDGQLVGVWMQPVGNQWHRWLQDDFDVPVRITAGKTSISVTIVPISHDDDLPVSWSAAQYQAISISK